MPTIYDHCVVGAYPHVKKDSPEALVVSRSLALSNPDDVVILHPALIYDYNEVLEYYALINYSVTKRVWFTDYVDLDRLPQNIGEYDVSRYLSYNRHNKKRPAGEDTLEYLNSKSDFLYYLKRLNLPIPHTMLHRLGVAKQKIPQYMTNRYVVKADLSCSGKNVYLCESPSEVQNVARNLQTTFGKAKYLIQEYLPNAEFFNAMAFLGDGDDTQPRLITRQLLEGFSHVGSTTQLGEVFVRGSEVYESAMNHLSRLIEWLTHIGCVGWIGFDFAITPEGKFYFLECNPRWNAALYSMCVAYARGWVDWESRRIDVEPQAFVAKDVIQFHPHSDSVITNWGTIRHGWIDVVSPL